MPSHCCVQYPVYQGMNSASVFSLTRAIHSRSLNPLLTDPGASRDYAYSEWNLNPSRCGVALKLRTVRTKTHKLTLELNSGAGELYHLAEDPDEMENRFGDPALKGAQKELTDMIRARPDDELETPLQPVGMA